MNFAVLQFPASNCDQDAIHAIQLLGHSARYVWHKEHSLGDADCVLVPGGFSYGDYLRCGAIARFSPVMEAVKQFGASDFIPFSYPYGTQDSYDRETKELVKNSGMGCAVTTIEGLNNFGSDPFELKRIEIGNFPVSLIKGIFNRLHALLYSNYFFLNKANHFINICF